MTGFQSIVLRLAFTSTAATTCESRARKPNHSEHVLVSRKMSVRKVERFSLRNLAALGSARLVRGAATRPLSGSRSLSEFIFVVNEDGGLIIDGRYTLQFFNYFPIINI